MIARVSQDISIPDRNGRALAPAPPHAALIDGSLLHVLLRRRWVFLGTLVTVIAGAVTYLLLATPLYTATSTLYIEQAGTKILTDAQAVAAGPSDNFLYTQAEIIKSAPILATALKDDSFRRMRTFDKIDDPILWLQTGHAFSTEVGKRNDLVTLSLDSPSPREGAEIVNSIVGSYMVAQGTRKKSTAAEMLKVLEKEKASRYAELSDKIRTMWKFKEENGALSFHDDKGNIILQRLAKLSDTLTNLELDAVQLKSEYETAKSTVQDASKIRAYVEKLQIARTGGGDKEYDEFRSELLKYQMALFTLSQIHGPNSESVQIVRGNIAGLREALATKEKAIVEEWVTQLEQDLMRAQANESQVRAAFLSQQKESLDLNSKEAEYARLEEEVQRTERQCGELDHRIKEVSVNSEDSGALNIQVVEPAKPKDKPDKPRKALTLAGALVLGTILATWMSMLRDRMDHRIRTPEDVADALGLPILGMVPRMPGPKTHQAVGTKVHLQPRSAIAEAYRAIRTAVQFGAAAHSKTILIASPASGDGKSITASNLSIALAHAGLRTLLLDADLRSPVQHKIFDVDGTDGLSSVLQGRRKLGEVIRRSVVPGLDVMPSGPLPANPSEIVAGSRFSRVIQALSEKYDRIVIDSPPVIAVTDSRILAAIADVTILVVRTNRSTRDDSQVALDALLRTGANVIGTVINVIPRRAAANAYRHYGTTYQAVYRTARHEPFLANPAIAALPHRPKEDLARRDDRDSPSDGAPMIN